MSTSKDPIYVARQGAVAEIVLNRPERMNALDLGMWRGLAAAAAEISADPAIRVVVVRGVGGRAFSAGADISTFERAYATPEAARSFNDAVREGQRALERLERPVIARIEGACVGGGCGIALHCDIRVAGQSAKFGITPARLGIAYSFEDTRRLVDTVGPAMARDILMTGRLLDAAEALRIGLVHKVVADNKVSGAVEAYAERLAENSQYTIRATKRTVQAISDGAAAPDADLARFIDGAFEAADAREGAAAFLAKRKPDFRWPE
ncbi:MAG: enoyl-CoA hydratase-related protein [Azospirillaceae bacterium]